LNNKRKILIFIDWFLPGYKAGGPVRSCANMIEALTDEYDFYVFTRNTDYTENNPYPLPANTWIQQNGFKAYYAGPDNLKWKTYQNIMQQNVYDAVYINGIYSKWFSIYPVKAAKKYLPNSKIIAASRGMLAPSAIQVKYFKKKIFLTWANVSGLYKNIVFHATNETEKKQIEKNIKHYQNIVVADNFPPVIKSTQKSIKQSDKLKLICIARIAPEKNQLYALSILKNCKTNIEYNLYGPIYDEAYWNECIKQINSMPAHIKVHYHGSIEPNRIMDILCEHDFLFMPTRGENYGHIIAESLSLGIPVILSTNTPWKNLQQHGAGYDIDLNNQQEFIEIIDRLSRLNHNEYMQISNQAKQYFANKYNRTVLINEYKKMFG
jgi:glycosyltransferase involved in cell wall biosynthesis